MIPKTIRGWEEQSQEERGNGTQELKTQQHVDGANKQESKQHSNKQGGLEGVEKERGSEPKSWYLVLGSRGFLVSVLAVSLKQNGNHGRHHFSSNATSNSKDICTPIKKHT